jgi:hypothetical protein
MRARLSFVDVTEMRMACAAGESTRVLAARYSVNPSTVRRVCTGRIRQHVPMPEGI